MIKKLNIALLVAFAVLLGLKALKNAVSVRKTQTKAPVVQVASEVSDLAPVIPYAEWEGYVFRNPITNRNGLLLDILREIFPKMKLAAAPENMESLAKLMMEEPMAVAVGFGEHPAIEKFPRSEIPIGYSEVVVCTRRTFSWKCSGPESLEKITLGLTEDNLDYPKVRAFYEKWKDDPSHVTLYSRAKEEQMYEDFRTEKVQGILVTKGFLENDAFGLASLYVSQLRESAPIDRGAIIFRVSNKDPEMTSALIRDYEAGMKRLRKSGVLRRIYEYYGKQLD